jgi:hypothetical protein
MQIRYALEAVVIGDSFDVLLQLSNMIYCLDFQESYVLRYYVGNGRVDETSELHSTVLLVVWDD